MVTVRSQGVSAGLERDVEELGIIKIQSEGDTETVRTTDTEYVYQGGCYR